MENEETKVKEETAESTTSATNSTKNLVIGLCGALVLLVVLLVGLYYILPDPGTVTQEQAQAQLQKGGIVPADDVASVADVDVEEKVGGQKDLYVTTFVEGWDERGKMVDAGTQITNGPALIDLGGGKAKYVGENEELTLKEPTLIWLYNSSDAKMQGEFLFFDQVVDISGNTLYQR